MGKGKPEKDETGGGKARKVQLGKKGQFYLITSIILIALAFTIIQNVGAQPKSSSAFVEIADSLESDSAIVLNQAIHDQKNVTEAYQSYMKGYLQYALTLDSTVKVIYVLNLGDHMVIHNGHQIPVNVNNGQYVIEP